MGPAGTGARVVRASCDVLGARSLLAPDELVALRSRRRGFDQAAAARAAAKEALRDALAWSGIQRALQPPAQTIVVRHDSRGRPHVELPEEAAAWMVAQGLKFDISIAHDSGRGAAAAVVAAEVATAEVCSRCGGTL
jgi:phosphopantetheinyl transferase (holo-ACP synthase)